MEPYSRRLPQVHPDGAWLFVTWRLAGSLPWPRHVLMPGGQPLVSAGAAFVALDRQADQARCGPRWLGDPRIARMLVDTLLAGERERQFYRLRAWVVMPNQVHVLWQPQVEMPGITRWVKGATARAANLLLGRTSQVFWQDESYDHWVRNGPELEKKVRYIEWNPVRAGLASVLEGWLWSSARLAGETACPTRDPFLLS